MYHFVFETPKAANLTESAHDRRRAELQDSDARSHAARIAYLKKTAPQHITHVQDAEEWTLIKAKRAQKFRIAVTSVLRMSSVTDDGWDDVDEVEKRRHRITARKKKVPKVKAPSSRGPFSRVPPQSGIPSRGKRVHSTATCKPESPEPRSQLPQTTNDPFDTFPNRQLPYHVKKVFQYGEFSFASTAKFLFGRDTTKTK